MRKYGSCLTIAGAGLILFGVLILLAVLIGYDPTGISSSLGVNLFVLGLFLLGFWGLGGGLIYAARKLKKDDA